MAETPNLSLFLTHHGTELQMRKMDGNKTEWRNSAITFDHVGWAYMALLQIATFKVGTNAGVIYWVKGSVHVLF